MLSRQALPSFLPTALGNKFTVPKFDACRTNGWIIRALSDRKSESAGTEMKLQRANNTRGKRRFAHATGRICCVQPKASSKPRPDSSTQWRYSIIYRQALFIPRGRVRILFLSCVLIPATAISPCLVFAASRKSFFGSHIIYTHTSLTYLKIPNTWRRERGKRLPFSPRRKEGFEIEWICNKRKARVSF